MNKNFDYILTFLNTYLVFIVIFTLFVIFGYILVKFITSKTLHKNHKFNVFLSMLSSLGAIVLSATLFLTLYYHNENISETSFQNYDTIWKKQNMIIQQFIDHPEMEYFHSDLYGKSYLNENLHYKRNIPLERNLFDMIMNDFATTVAYLENYKYTDSENKKKIKERLDILVSLHKKSKIFIEYWNSYKKIDATPDLVRYMKENYDI